MDREKTCTVRVPDHTDFVDCGDRVLRANRCAQHLHEEVASLESSIDRHEEAITRARARIEELTTESG